MPAGFGAEMDTALGDAGPTGAVEGDDDGDGTGPLAVGVLVVGVGVLDPVVAVGVDLRNPCHASRAQVEAGAADGLRTASGTTTVAAT